MDKPIPSPKHDAKREWILAGLALAAILGLAAALRFYRLDGQSLWNDEGTSVALAGRSLSVITQSAAADIHPPLYHYLLHYWLAIFGSGQVAARSLSAVFGVALVGLTFVMGRRLFGALAGWAAATFAAVYSYQVYYAQEARMYMLLAFLGAASSYLFYLGWLAPGVRRRVWAVAGWVLVTALAAYTHYLAAGVVLAQNVAFVAGLVIAARRPGEHKPAIVRPALAWAGAQALVGALYLPWLWLTWAQLNRWPATSEPFSFITLLKQGLVLFVLGPTAQLGNLRLLVVAVLGLAVLGFLWPDRPGEDTTNARLLAALHWAMPVALLYYLSLSRPVYHPKFLLLATPGLLFLLGRAVARLAPAPEAWGRPWVAWVRGGVAGCAALAVVASNAPGLYNSYFDARYARDDYRGIAAYISALGQPGDVVLINAPSQIETVAYYYHGPLPMVPIPLQRPPDREQTLRRLEQVTHSSQRIFGIFWATNESDPERIVEGWLDEHAYKALDAWYGRVRLVVYATPAAEMGDEIQHPLAVNLGGQVRLDGYTLGSTEVEAGDILQLNLYWEATNVIQRRYKVFTHVIDEAGHLVGQRDAEPGGGVRFTNTWQEGEQIVDRYGLPILQGTPPGEYLIEVGMYNPEDGLRLPLVEGGKVTGDRVILQKVRVVRPQVAPPPAALDMRQARPIKDSSLQLLGYSFGRLGAAYEGAAAYGPGEAVELVLFWQALQTPRGDVQANLRLVDRSGQVRFEQRGQPTGGRYPPAQWQPGEVVRDSIHLRLPGDLTPGQYRLLLGWEGTTAAESVPWRELLRFSVQ
ncbi:MAG TPA: glycosyltransferase family 39 protein [Anaerolineae bacterium]|nr:glycosyltransferase family 39 protein [Anaerolineae bacterium]HPL29104.1 glycosyltransferase family 39 protein [Anaerolineae bacterium]